MMNEDIPTTDDERVGTFPQFQKSIGIAIELNLPQFDLHYGCDQQDYHPLAQLEAAHPTIIQKEITDWAVFKSANPYALMLSRPVSNCRRV